MLFSSCFVYFVIHSISESGDEDCLFRYFLAPCRVDFEVSELMPAAVALWQLEIKKLGTRTALVRRGVLRYWKPRGKAVLTGGLGEKTVVWRCGVWQSQSGVWLENSKLGVLSQRICEEYAILFTLVRLLGCNFFRFNSLEKSLRLDVLSILQVLMTRSPSQPVSWEIVSLLCC